MRSPAAKQARNPLMPDSRNRLAAYFTLAERAAHIGYWRYDLQDGAHYWSPGMYVLMGVDPQERHPDNEWLRRQLPESEQKVVAAMLRAAIQDGKPFSYRVRDVTLGPLLNLTGQIIDTQGEVELGADGRVTALIGVCQNVTQRVRAEEARAMAQEQYRVMTREASDIIIFYSATNKILFVSEALERILGRSVSEIENGRYLDIIHPNDVEEAQKINGVPKFGETPSATYRARHRDGHYVWIEVVKRAIYDDDGEVKNIVSVSRDISQRKTQEIEMAAAQARAEAANQAKSRFLANMSHELRTPLNAIIGFTELMRQKMFGPLGNERYDEYATIIYDSGQHLLDLITDMLDMAKIEAGKLKLNFEQVDLNVSIEDCKRLLTDRAAAGGVTIHTRQGEPVFLAADRRAVKQVLLNLLSNAVKFTPAGGTVSAWAERHGERVCVVVKDTGIGIAPEDLERLGNPFEQAMANPFVAQGGTGLGLALVKSLAECHGGTMTIASVEGQGTTVTVEFPSRQTARQVA